jgi:hypothetical protein
MLGCAGNGVSPSNGSTNSPNMANKGEDFRCKEFSNFASYALNAHVMPTNIEDGLGGPRCEPIEIIVCDGVEYGITLYCPSSKVTKSIFD